ncbi:MAG: DUF1592 domain-containing protein, partial [Myxococcota bacterium]
ELLRTLSDLLGETVFEEVAIAFGTFPQDDVGTHVERFAALHAVDHAEAMLNTGEAAAQAYLDNPDELSAMGFGCITDPDVNQDCIDGFIEGFGQRVFRRPLTAEERDAYGESFAAAPHAREGFIRLMMRFLSAPELLFHVEVAGELSANVLRLDAYAVANRISYLILGTMPPETLFAAAESGELDTLSGIETQVRALLEDPRAKEHIGRFFEAWLSVGEIPGVADEEGLLQGLDRGGLREAMLDELWAFVDAQLWGQQADLRTLLTAQRAYATDDRVASILGVSTWDGTGEPPATGAERAGLLLRPALLLSDVHSTAPIHRGVFVRRAVLCDDLPSPDSEIVNSRLEELEQLDPASIASHEQIAALTEVDGCISCHAHINPLAFALEDFDRLGRHRSVERVFEGAEVVAEHPLPADIAIEIDENAVVSVSSGAELAMAIAETEKAHACFVRRVFETTRTRRATVADQCQMGESFEQLYRGNGSLLDTFVANVVHQSIFTRKIEGADQ